jgi:hypothetical protein
MFIGHFGVALGAKAVAPKVSLGTLFLAAQFIDLLWPTFLLLGIEHVRIEPGATAVVPLDFVSYPISHSLLAVGAWALLVAGTYQALCRDRRGALVLGLVVVSHWLLDAIVHRPDLPLVPGGSYLVGLGLWSSLVASQVVEIGLFAVGAWLYVRTTTTADALGDWTFWGLIGFLALVHAANLFGPPPPNVTALAWVGQAQWLLVAWGYWVDRHRHPNRPM